MKKSLLVICCLTGVTAFMACHYTSVRTWSSLVPAFVKDSTYLLAGSVYSEEKALLGRYLFYDRRLSVNNAKACSSCHAQENSFTDGYTRSIGAFGDLHQRNSRPLINLIFNRYLLAADSTIHFPEQQIQQPMLNISPVEMGWKGNEEMILQRLRRDKKYAELFSAAFPAAKIIGLTEVQESIICFVKTIFSFDSPYDRYQYRNQINALTAEAQHGRDLFFDVLHCNNCHGGITFARPSKAKQLESSYFYNMGVDKSGSNRVIDSVDQGLYALTRNENDRGKFRIATLRNLAFTAPYLHDGSANSLLDVLLLHNNENEARQISRARSDTSMRNSVGYHLNSKERRELTAFLLSLSDSSIRTNPQYANPFTNDETRNTSF